MITEKIENVIRTLDKLEFMVPKEAWKVIGLAMAELKDAATSTQALENHQSIKPSGLTIIDIFGQSDGQGHIRVCPARLGDLLGDLAEALADVNLAQAEGRPRLAVVPAPEGE